MVYVLPSSPTNGQIISTTTDKYVWNGSAWAKNSAIYTTKLSGSVVVPAVTYNATTNIVAFTIPRAGKFVICASINHGCSTTFTITNSIIGSTLLTVATGNMQYTGTGGFIYGHIVMNAIVTLTGAETFTLRSVPVGGTVNSTANSSLVWFEL